jgi:hypothetical protein
MVVRKDPRAGIGIGRGAVNAVRSREVIIAREPAVTAKVFAVLPMNISGMIGMQTRS